MAQDALSVALIGLGGTGTRMLEALLAMDQVAVLGVADHDAALAERIGHETHLPAYSDNRSLLAETRPQVVFLATPPMAAPDILAACAERGIHIWKDPPLARSLTEGVAMVRLMESAGLKLAVGTQRRFATGYHQAAQLLGKLGPVFLASAHYMFNWGPQLGWRGDASSAGGGALLELGYHPIDLLVWLLGLPEEVYGISSGGHRPEDVGPNGQDLPAYDTDDTAAAVLRYGGGCMATISTTRRSGPLSEQLTICGRRGSICADVDTCTLRDPDGNLIDQSGADPAPVAIFQRQAEAFAAAVRRGTKPYECSARENLLDLAVIEAIYLSSRTSQPESPLRLLQAHDLTVAKCLMHRPAAAGPQLIDPDAPGEPIQ